MTPRHRQWRFARVTPRGLLLDVRVGAPRAALIARVEVASPARTLYVRGRPECRAERGDRGTRYGLCKSCPKLHQCTPQTLVVLDVPGERALAKLLLSHTNAENLAAFAAEHARLPNGATSLHGLWLRIVTTPRKSETGRPWGELTFARARPVGA